jgi:hypothetical protein
MRIARLLAPAAVLVVGLARAGEPSPRLKNAGFTDWQGGVPAEWRVEIGASQGEGPASTLERGEEGGVAFRGDGATRIWKMISQTVAVVPGTTYRLSYELRGRGLKGDPGQTDNAYVRIVERGVKSPRLLFATAEREAWTPGEVVFRAAGAEVDVAAFLSKTGTLEVRALALEALRPEHSLDVLARHMDRYYSFFETKKIDWAKLVAAHRERIAAARDEAGFVEGLKDLLAALRDPHTWIRTSDGRLVYPWTERPAGNYDFQAIAGTVSRLRRIDKHLVGSIGDDIGYAAITSLLEPMDPALDKALAELLDRKGIVLDLRANGGGAEMAGMAIAARFADRPRLYALRRRRDGPAHGDFGPARESWLRPAGEKPFSGPVVVLIGPHCISSGEGFVQMLRVLPNVTTVGRATRGASGNPVFVDLPNGVSVAFSRWVNFLPDGTPTEGRGIPPDVEVVHEGPGDPTLRAGVEDLRRRMR